MRQHPIETQVQHQLMSTGSKKVLRPSRREVEKKKKRKTDEKHKEKKEKKKHRPATEVPRSVRLLGPLVPLVPLPLTRQIAIPPSLMTLRLLPATPNPDPNVLFKVKYRLCPIFQADFEDEEKNIIRWLALAEEPRVREYLTKLLTQVKIAGRVLLSLDRLNNEHCRKLITLWKCAKRRDVAHFFKLKEHLRDAVEEEVPAISKSSLTEESCSTESLSESQITVPSAPITITSTSAPPPASNMTMPTLVNPKHFEWLLEDGSFIPYRKCDDALIAEAYKRYESGTQEEFILEVGDRKYKLDFARWIQTNCDSGVPRAFHAAVHYDYSGPPLFDYARFLNLEEGLHIIKRNACIEVVQAIAAFTQVRFKWVVS
jgi:hypothetical protein